VPGEVVLYLEVDLSTLKYLISPSFSTISAGGIAF
jgi:hypothetical protein